MVRPRGEQVVRDGAPVLIKIFSTNSFPLDADLESTIKHQRHLMAAALGSLGRLNLLGGELLDAWRLL
jgi:hypothetical protein